MDEDLELLPTWTYYWQLERKLRRIQEIELPRQVGLVEAIGGGLTLLILVLGAWTFGVSLSWDNAAVFIVAPLAVGWLCGQRLDVFDACRPHVWAWAQLRFLLWEPRQLARLEPVRERGRVQLRIWVWQPRGGDS